MRLTNYLATAPTQEQLVAYQNACASVNRYAYAITNTNMPVLKDPPAHYEQFATGFSPAKAHCLEWTNGIFPALVALPNNIVNQAGLFDRAGEALDAFIANPKDPATRQALEDALGGMKDAVSNELAAVGGLRERLWQFTKDVEFDANGLAAIAADALAAAGADQEKIAQLSTHIDSLKQKIDLENKIGSDWALTATPTVMILGGVACCFIPGGVFFGVGLIIFGLVLEIAPVASLIEHYKELSEVKTVTTDYGKIADEKQDIILLQALSMQFQWLMQANSAAEAALNTIANMWWRLGRELDALAGDLLEVDAAVGYEVYPTARRDLSDASPLWADIVATAKALAGADYKWQDKQGNLHSFTENPPPLNGSMITPLGEGSIAQPA
jgi:hypothetical protein